MGDRIVGAIWQKRKLPELFLYFDLFVIPGLHLC